ncbi:hypothetical protein INT45_002150 [Circinella minor]|uniref:Protein Zds1 C-terminal domain-containing protein n=1 Tax=Circinella minor TaxID=1195481 RepID=A0A8H7SEP1_9FUNG|nr:hypothetical protein INT45_002150 [Circinella minor]
MSDVKYTSRSFDAYPTQITPKSPPPPPPEHLYLPPLPPLDSNSITNSFDSESPAFANNAPDSRNTSAPTQPPSLEDHHHDNVSTADESDSVVNSTNTSRTFSISSFNRDEDVPKDTEPSKVINIETPNPSHLFWVPAAQHPEIAPNEFEIFLQHNAMAKRERSSLKRRSSILSVSFTASDAEKQENNENRLEGDNRNDALQALERGNRHGSSERNERIQLLQQQQENDSNKGGGEEGSQRKARLRRSLSLDTATAAENQMRVPDFLVFDRNSSPLDQSKVLVPKADRPSLLRRGARTRFQRNSSFTPPSARQQVDRHRQAESMPPGAYTERFDSSAFEEGIVLSDGPLELTSNFSLPLAEPSPLPPHHNYQQQQEGATSEASTTFTPRPMERRASAEEIPRLQNRSSSTKTHEIQALEIGQNVVTQESTPSDHTTHEQQQQQHPDVPTQSSSERKSAWSWGFKRSKSEQVRGDVSADKVHLQAEAVPRPRPSVSTESSSNSNASATTPTHLPSNNGGKENGGKRSFGLSSLFSRKSSASKGQTTSPYPTTTNTAPTAPKDFQLNRINQNRLPIHIERTIYRLSHSKLANPRRPLHEQVLISNLMFWYLSLVSSPQQQQHQQPNGTSPDNKTRKFVNPGKKGKRRPQSNSSSPRQSSPQSHHNHQQQKQKQQHHPQEQKQSQSGHNRPPSLSNGSSPQQQQKNRSNSKQQQQENGNVVLNQYMGASTGFVVPENYLKPRQQGSKGMAGVGRNSSLSDSDEDDDDDDGVLSDSSSDEEPSNNNVTMKARVAAATKHRTSNDLVPNHNTRVSKQRGDDNLPLAMYRKGKA